MSNLDTDLNETIAAAVNARIEATVTQALSGDEVMSKYVAAALRSPMPKPANSYGRDPQPSFLKHTLDVAMQNATKAAVNKWMVDHAEELEALVATALRRNIKDIAGAMVGSLQQQASKSYGMSLKIDMNIRGIEE